MSARYRSMSVACRYLSRRRRLPTSSSRPRRLWWSCLWVFRCSVRSAMRLREHCDLDLGAAGVALFGSVLGDDGLLGVRVKGHGCLCIPLGRVDHQRPSAWLVQVAVLGAPAPWPSPQGYQRGHVGCAPLGPPQVLLTSPRDGSPRYCRRESHRPECVGGRRVRGPHRGGKRMKAVRPLSWSGVLAARPTRTVRTWPRRTTSRTTALRRVPLPAHARSRLQLPRRRREHRRRAQPRRSRPPSSRPGSRARVTARSS